MKRSGVSVAAAGLLILSVMGGIAEAGEPLSFHCSGMGVFSPTNIGTARGGNAGIILGDGSGVSRYVAAGDVFTIDGEPVGGTGENAHEGEVLSRTTGILRKGRGEVRWPAESGANHVLSSSEGEIEFKYAGGFVLDLEAFAAGEPSFSGEALFVIVGGTGRFADARGIVWVDVQVPFALPGLPPAGAALDIPFEYDFNGFIILAE